MHFRREDCKDHPKLYANSIQDALAALDWLVCSWKQGRSECESLYPFMLRQM